MEKTMKILKFICAIALLTTMVNAANIVVNHSFNEGLPAPNEWAPAEWNQDAPGGTMGRIFNDSSDAGTNCQYLAQPSITAGNHSQLELGLINGVMPVGAHTKVYWSAAYKVLSSPAPAGGALIQIRAWDAGGAFLGQDQFYPSAGGTLDTWINEPAREWTFPVGTDHLDILADQGSWPWSEMSGTLYVDNFQVDFIPEPTLLVGGLLLGLAFLRRK